ncbi:MAG: UDP-N-acetylmuramoyl-L-alanine--D-glutamate ligase [Clostridia bacterium]|nr:UDP-N-acetylmuramoyl-L-alanine--D-glutamate ligase [Clostridia bacterium]
MMQGKKAMVFGMARSGIAAAKLLLSRGAEVYICDARTEADFDGALDDLKAAGAHLLLGEQHPEALLDGMDALIVSPGIPVEHPAVVRAKALGIEVMGEIEYAYREATGLLLAITGTNGKTTTTTLLGEIFKNAGRRTFVVGNIGTPYSGAVAGMKPGDVTVCEISSFMMETSSKFHPAISAVLNISEDHLNRHGTMERYIALKERIFENSAEDDYVILNWDDPATRDMANRARCRVSWFSSRNEVPFGAFVRDGMIVYGTPQDSKPVCPAKEVYIPGEHNLKNALAATAMAMAAGIPAPVIRHTLKTFMGVEHRIEFVRELDGVRFINDSKGTNVDSTIQAVRAMDRPTVLILGGYDKHTDFTPLCEEIVKCPISRIVLIGATAKQLEETLENVGYHAWTHAGYDFKKAIELAFAQANAGGNVLLSPSCASFDMFKDYEARGRIFKDIVNALEGKRA